MLDRLEHHSLQVWQLLLDEYHLRFNSSVCGLFLLVAVLSKLIYVRVSVRVGRPRGDAQPYQVAVDGWCRSVYE